MTLANYAAVIGLMQDTPGVRLREADSRAAIARYLERNPGLSLVAEDAGRVVGCLMCGHDGRRGYLQHLTLAPSHRCRGIAQTLVESCLERLQALGILKTHVDVLLSNQPGIDYWTKRGWKQRDDILRFSFIRAGGDNA